MKSTDLEQFIGIADAGFIAVLESLNEGIIILDLDGRVQFANERIVEITGYSKIELCGKRVYEFFFPSNSKEQEEGRLLMEARHNARLKGVSDTYETQITRKDGKKRWIETKASPLIDESGKIVGSIGAHFDITDRKEVEDQLRWSQKMEAVGRLAGGVAHDFNNLLTVIQGYGTLLRQQLVSADLDVKRADVILEAAEAASTLTQQLLSISLRQVVQMVPVCLNDVVERSLRVVHGLVGERIEVRVKLLPHLPLMLGDPAQLQQIFLNLVVNARDAMPHGGLLTISTELVDGRGYPVLFSEKLQDASVRLSVQDSGHGIDEATKSRIFEPFFTTKRSSLRGTGVRGSGLGLSVTFGIVKEHGGDIRVFSEPGQGARFDVTFSMIPPQQTEKTEREDWRPLTGSEVVLLAEDQVAVRVLLKETFELYGYTVIEAVDGQEAVELAERYPGRIDALITDLVMPRLSGLEAAQQILRARPGVRVLIISGYPDEADVWEKIRQNGFAFLAKPFNSDTIAKFLRSILDESQKASGSTCEA